MSSNSIETFGIIGSGEFGRLAARHLATRKSEILIHDQNPDVDLPRRITAAKIGDVLAADAILLAVPFGSYEDLRPQLEKVPEETLLIDVCSVKVKPTVFFRQNLLIDRPDALITHPLFGPQTTGNWPWSVHGKKVVVTPDSQVGPRSKQVLHDWARRGIGTVPMSPERHDKEMARVQALTFFVLHSLVDMSPELHEDTATNTYRTLFSLMEVEMKHSPELRRTMWEHNPYSPPVILQYINRSIINYFNNLRVEAYPTGLTTDPIKRLEDIRGLLDMVDESSDYLLAIRTDITDSAGVNKADAGLPMRDREREAELIEKTIERSRRLGLPEEYLTRLRQATFDMVVERNSANKTSDTANQPTLDLVYADGAF